MDWFFVVSLLMSVITLGWGVVVLLSLVRANKKHSAKSGEKIKITVLKFREEVEKSYEKQIKLVNEGSIKMNILTNDSDGDNELRIMNNFRRMIQSPMFEVIARVKGDFEI